MTIWEQFVYTFVCGALLAVSVLGLESAAVATGLDRWERRFFVAFFVALLPCSLSFFLSLVALMNPDLVVLQEVSDFIQSVSAAIAFPMLTLYLLHSCGEDWRSSTLFRVMLALWTIYLALLVATRFTTVFFWYGPHGEPHFGPAYNLLITPVLVMQLLDVAAVVRRRSRLSRQQYRAFMVSLLPVTVVVIFHMFVAPVFTFIDVSLTLSVYSAYRLIVSDSIEQNLRQQREIAQQRASIAVLQMRPHFICNTMTCIYYLCDQDPELAKQVTLDFTTYLRKNFTAIAREDTIPFTEELEHARAYLAVEEAQYEGDLLVSYDTPHTGFRVPPLTLQPIVENAIKHGMDPDAGPLRIWIRTEEADSASKIIVENDGVSFDPMNDDEPHTAIENIRQRLSMMCRGQLAIVPRVGGGTVVRVTIPRQA